ncbi:unnamed protein product [Rotaria sp. Silwood1]|nr:unnamed protein product [Rotaria sp. Silwood1]
MHYTIFLRKCPTAPVFAFIQSSSISKTMSINGKYNLLTDGIDNSTVLTGAYVPMMCNKGYVHAGGQLNITCTDNAWTTFPTCVAITVHDSLMIASSPASNALPCTIDVTTFNITNGYSSNASLSSVSSNAVTGWIQFACMPGYALDSTVGALYTCNNGVWSTKPRCLITGRCSFSALQDFIMNATGLKTTGQSQLMQASQETSLVLDGSYIVVACGNGYTNMGGSLNITCSASGSWSPFPRCVLNSGSGSETTPMVPSGNACVVDATTLNTTNGYYSNISLSYTSNTTATGWIQFACMPGYTLDPMIGALYTCNNGVWSAKPRCLTTGRCSFSALQNFMNSNTGLQTTGQSQLMQVPQETNVVLSGSYIVVVCMNGYTNIGGSLNITCSASGSWSPFPNCVLNGGSGSQTTPMVPSGNACIVDTTTLTLTNGYSSNASLSSASSNTATGWIQFACMPGYALDPMIGALYTCNNGVWSAKPRCLTTGRCSFSALQNFMSSAPGLQTTTQSQLMQVPQETNVVLSGSYIVVTCMNGYTNMGGSLNITCSASSSWSSFPNCVLSTQTTTVSPNSGAPCNYNPSLMTIPNGYSSSSNGLMLPTATQAISGAYISYMCTPPYALVGNSVITCTNGVWSPQPVCVAAGSGSVTTRPSSLKCTEVPIVANSYVSSATSIQYSNNTYQRKVEFKCNPGYTYVSTSGQLVVWCTNGVWDRLPICVASPSCPVNQLQSALVNVEIVSRSLYAGNGGILAGGWIQLRCASGYILKSSPGSLNITCLSTGAWSPFPSCSQ